MNKCFRNCFKILILFFLMSCQTTKKDKTDTPKNLNDSYSQLTARFDKLIDYPVNPSAIPRSIDKNLTEFKTTSSGAWTSGFFAGNLWYIYRLTDDEKVKKKALKWTKIVEGERNNDSDHDIGFKIFNSFGNAYKITPDEAYKKVIIESANTLLTRYDDDVKAIKSWNSKKGKWDYPVIIDNMMNLELLFEASLLTNDSLYYNIAVNHANTTLKNHFREDHSTYHVVDYLPDGSVNAKKTYQGYNDNSLWARGHAWAIYGFTMAYRYTKDKTYLNQAEQSANFYLNHNNLPSDGIPYWDFDDPNIPNAPKDVSAATIITSAFFELYKYTKNDNYINYAHKVLENLYQPEYLLDKSVDTPFILKRSTGNYNKNSELDCPIVYADYYFLEALVRKEGVSN